MPLTISRLPTGVILATFNRPERLNALSEDMARALIKICREADADSSCRGLIFTGSERAFSTGRDLKLSVTHSPADAKRYLDLANESVLALAETGVPTCAAVDGHCLGWGFEFSLAASFRVVARTSRLRLPETSLGLFPGAGGAVLVPRVIGRAKANDLIMTAREISGIEAFELGVATRLAAEGQTAKQCAIDFMSLIADNAPLAVRAGIKAMNRCEQIPDIRTAFKVSRELRDPLTNTHDHQEALRAFAEKRRPVFTGK